MHIRRETVFITGGGGLIGRHLVAALADVTGKVIVYDNLSTGSLDNIRHLVSHPRFTFVEGDLLDREATAHAKNQVKQGQD